MAQFTNQAQLSYNNITVNSNITVGELLETLTATKYAVGTLYAADSEVTYVISLINSSSSTLTGIRISDDLGAYPFGEETRTPLTYIENSVRLYADGVLQPAPTATTTSPLVFENITIPANGNVLLAYKTEVNSFAPLDAQASIVNTATITGNAVPTPIVTTETITSIAQPQLTITKSLEPAVVTEESTLTYQFVIQNYGNTDAVATDNVALTDTFNPILSTIIVTLNDVPLAEGTDYTYDETSGVFATTPGRILVPAATYTQDPITGTFNVVPGVTTLTVSGTI